MVLTANTTPKARYTYEERTVRALDEIRRSKRKYAIHGATIKARIKKNVQLLQDKTGPHSNTYINKALGVFQANGAIVAAPERYSYSFTPEGIRIIEEECGRCCPPGTEMSEKIKDKIYKNSARRLKGLPSKGSKGKKRGCRTRRIRSRGAGGSARQKQLTEKQWMRRSKLELVRELRELLAREKAAAGVYETIDVEMIDDDDDEEEEYDDDEEEEDEEEEEEDTPLPIDEPSYPDFASTAGYPRPTVEISIVGRRDSIQQHTPPSSARSPPRISSPPFSATSQDSAFVENNHADNASEDPGDAPMTPVFVDQEDHRPYVSTTRQEFPREVPWTERTRFGNHEPVVLTNRIIFPPEEESAINYNSSSTQTDSSSPSLSPPPPNQLQLQERLEAEMPGYKPRGPPIPYPYGMRRFDSGTMVHTEGRFPSPGVDIDKVNRLRRGRRSDGVNYDVDVGAGAGEAGYNETMDIDSGLNDSTMVPDDGFADDDDDDSIPDGNITNFNNEAEETLTNDDNSPILSPETRRLDKGKGLANPIPIPIPYHNDIVVNLNDHSMEIDFEPVGSSSFIRGAHHEEEIGDTSTIRSDDPDFGLLTPDSTPQKAQSQSLPISSEEIERMTSELKTAQKRIVDLELIYEELVCEKEKVDEDLIEAENNIENLNVELELFPDEMHTLRNSYDTVIRQRDQLQARHGDLVSRNADVLARKEKECQDQIAQIKLEEAQKILQAELDLMKADRDLCQHQKNEALAKVGSLEALTKLHESVHKENIAKIERLEAEIEIMEQQNKKVADEKKMLYEVVEKQNAKLMMWNKLVQSSAQFIDEDANDLFSSTSAITSASASTSTAMNVD